MTSAQHSTASLLSFWFESGEKLFEAFFERKLELYGGTVALAAQRTSIGPEGVPEDWLRGAALAGPLRSLGDNSVFLDPFHELVERIYVDLPTGFDTNSDEQYREAGSCAPETRSSDNASLYGELTSMGLRQMLSHFGRGPADATTPSADPFHFVDLGSGTGKVVLESALLLRRGQQGTENCGRNAFVGIELSADRAAVADNALQRLVEFAHGGLNCALRSRCDVLAVREAAARAARCIHLRCGSFFDDGLWRSLPLPTRGTHFFSCGVGFGAETIQAICELLAQCAEGGGNDVPVGSPSFTSALLLFRSKPRHRLFDQLCDVSVVAVHTTWMDDAPAYLLHRKRQ